MLRQLMHFYIAKEAIKGGRKEKQEDYKTTKS